MGFLDEVMGSIGGKAGGASSIQGVLTGLLGGGQAEGQATQGASGGMDGGLGSLIQRFEGAGLGGIAQSWIGNGPNQPITPQQLHGALGENQVQSMSSQSGIPMHDLLAQLSQHLPGIVDRLTPGGQLPGAGSSTISV